MKLAPIALSCLFVVSSSSFASAGAQEGLDRFNRALDAATRHLDNVATMALWEDDGVSLLPSMPPIEGKKAIARFLDDVTTRYPGGHMVTFEMACHTIAISGDSASEWCSEHQVVHFGGSTPPFDGRGTMLLVLHRHADGEWRLKAEMWNPAPKP